MENKQQHKEVENNISSIISYLLKEYKDLVKTTSDDQLTIIDIVERIVHYYESIIFCMPCNVYWLNSDCVTVGCNKNVLDMFGFTKTSAFKGLSFEEMGVLGRWSPEATASFKQDTQYVINHKKGILNIEEPVIPHNNGNLIYFLSSRVPLFDLKGEVVAVVGISVDITERKHMEQGLREAKEAAEIANRAKTEFLRNARHDIRTPLAGIVGFLDLLQKETNISNIRKYTSYLFSSSKNLLNFSNIILSSVDCSSGLMPSVQKKFNLRKKIYEAINIYRVKALEKGISLYAVLDPLIPTYVIGDSVRIFRIIMELIGNALKYTQQGYVKVSASLEKITGLEALINFSVEDSGVGISPDKQLLLFEKYNKYKTANNNSSGLGLLILKEFVQELGGKISINSNVTEGTKFTCVFPMRLELKEREISKPGYITDRVIFGREPINEVDNKLIPDNHPIKVLVVEDQLHASLVIKELLELFMCQADIANDGYKAMNLFEKNYYDLVLMDIGLPYMDGYQVTQKLRLYEKRFNYKVPIVALTAHFCLEEQKKCIKADMNAIFTKPLFKQSMLDILQMFVDRFEVKGEFLEISQEVEYEE